MAISLSLKNAADHQRPAVDEWGIYDPDQAGLTAVLERVEARRRAAAETDAQAMGASMREANALAAVPKTRTAK